MLAFVAQDESAGVLLDDNRDNNGELSSLEELVNAHRGRRRSKMLLPTGGRRYAHATLNGPGQDVESTNPQQHTETSQNRSSCSSPRRKPKSKGCATFKECNVLNVKNKPFCKDSAETAKEA